MDEPAAYFHLSFAPNLTLVSTVRRFTGDFYRRILADHEVASRLALATHELLENAVAYAADGETRVRVELAGATLTVRTWNRTSALNREVLTSAIDELSQAPDPGSYYQKLLHETTRRVHGSGLGLARVRAEADMTVSYEIERDDQVCVIATAQIPTAEAA